MSLPGDFTILKSASCTGKLCSRMLQCSRCIPEAQKCDRKLLSNIPQSRFLGFWTRHRKLRRERNKLWRQFSEKGTLGSTDKNPQCQVIAKLCNHKRATTSKWICCSQRFQTLRLLSSTVHRKYQVLFQTQKLKSYTNQSQGNQILCEGTHSD